MQIFLSFGEVELPLQDIQTQALEALKNLPIEGDYSVSIPQEPYYLCLEEQLNSIWMHRPDILTFHFGIPPLSIIEKAHSLGIAIGITATSLKEARAIENWVLIL
jgi:nitronate monooxygenase